MESVLHFLALQNTWHKVLLLRPGKIVSDIILDCYTESCVFVPQNVITSVGYFLIAILVDLLIVLLFDIPEDIPEKHPYFLDRHHLNLQSLAVA